MGKPGIQELIAAYMTGGITAEELATLKQLLSSEDRQDVVEALGDMIQRTQPDTNFVASDWTIVWEGIINTDKQLASVKEQPNLIPAHRVHFLRTAWFRYAAAVFAMVACIAIFYYYIKSGKDKPVIAVHNTPEVKSIAPGGNKAVLMLADGRHIVLDSAGEGSLAEQGGIKVLKLNSGLLSYTGTNSNAAVLYNTITTPRGGQYQLILADGSKVWLNALSSLRFPTAFTGSERNVELTGEAYFEVAKDASKKFIVSYGNIKTEVLGTHFNVHAYSDDEAVKVTLLEGAVKVSNGSAAGLLKPGQQAEVTDGLKVMNDADTEEAVAWKNGLFLFNNTPLTTIMKQIARWYDVEVVYAGGGQPKAEFSGSISRNTNLEEMLKVLDYSDVKFKVQGKTITVMP